MDFSGVVTGKSRGRGGGRSMVMTPGRIEIARSMREQIPKATWETIAAALGVGVSSVRRALDSSENLEAVR